MGTITRKTCLTVRLFYDIPDHPSGRIQTAGRGGITVFHRRTRKGIDAVQAHIGAVLTTNGKNPRRHVDTAVF